MKLATLAVLLDSRQHCHVCNISLGLLVMPSLEDLTYFPSFHDPYKLRIKVLSDLTCFIMYKWVGSTNMDIL